MTFGGDWRLGFGVIIVASSVVVCTNNAQDAAPMAVEPEVREAFDRALARYPEPLRSRLTEIDLAREPNYGIPDDSPLMLRLMGNAAYAYFSNFRDRVVILDAGLAEQSRWSGGDADPEAVAGLMNDLAIALDTKRGDSRARWAAFVQEVQSWDPQTTIEGEIRFGDARVLDRFVRLGVGRSLALAGERSAEMDLEAQMIHELAHALQLSREDGGAMAHLMTWGKLSGWVRSDNGEPFDGFHGGVMMMEQPQVLGRLLLNDTRGEGFYEHDPAARFVNRYAAYDPREDYAESMRLFFENPARLLEIAPAKFLFINALGYNAELDMRNPGPLWITQQEIIDHGWQDSVQIAAAELLEGRDEIVADPRTIAGLLRAHASLLSDEGLPRRAVYSGAPSDVPEQLADVVRPEDFSVRIGGFEFGPSPAAVESLLASAIMNWHESDEFHRDLDAWFDPEPTGLEEDFIELTEQQDPQLRAMEAARFLDKAWGFVDSRRYAEMASREIRYQREAGHELLAETLLVRMAIVRGGEVLRDRIRRSSRQNEAVRYDEIELQAAVVDAWFATENTEEAIAAAEWIQGDSWGLIRRTEARCRAAQVTGQSDLLDVCEQELASFRLTSLSEYLKYMVKNSREAIAESEKSE